MLEQNGQWMFWFAGKFHTSVATFLTRSKVYLRGLA